MIKWPVEEIGRNSVTPSTTPSKMASVMRSLDNGRGGADSSGSVGSSAHETCAIQTAVMMSRILRMLRPSRSIEAEDDEEEAARQVFEHPYYSVQIEAQFVMGDCHRSS